MDLQSFVRGTSDFTWDVDFIDALDHGIRVSRLSSAIARECGFDEQVCYELAKAGMIHDLGKLRMQNYFYGEEAAQVDVFHDMKYMRMHSTYSYEIISEKKEYSQLVLDSVLFHHENYDGTGYPMKLQGRDIPFGARILRISDVFVALTSNRPYRSAFCKEEALRIMIDDVKNFDMEYFLAFQRVINTRWKEEKLDFVLINKEIKNEIKGETENGVK